MFSSKLNELYDNRFFAGIDKKELSKLKPGMFIEKTIRKGGIVIEQDTDGDEMYLIVSGEVEISRITSNINIVLGRRGPGEYVGEMALFDGKLRSATVTAMSELQVYILDSHNFFKLINQYDKIKNNLIRIITSTIRENGIKYSQKSIAHNKLLSYKDVELVRMQGLLEQTMELKREIDEQKAELELINRELEKKNRELYRLTIIDDLTHVYSRLHFNRLLDNEFSRSSRHGIELSILVIDIDYFKDFNDTYGHLIGDRVLKETAGVISSVIRKEDVLGRIGGEEFAIILPHMGLEEAISVADKIQEQVEENKIAIGGIEHSVTVSIGVTDNIIGSPLCGKDLLHHGDMALYKAKKNGRNRVEVYTKGLCMASLNS